MARARNIKPSFFQNEQLGMLNALDRLTFIGMWTIADYKGCIEFRPMRLKVQIMPYDNCDIEEIAINLDKSGLIRMYSVQGKRYLKIINFNKHQNPHKNEVSAGSEIPDITEADEVVTQAIDNKEVTINRDLSGLKRNKDGSAPAESLILIPDSLIPLPDSLLLIPGSPGGSQPAQKKQSTETELLKNYGVDGQLAKDFLKIRKAKKAPITETALKGI
jgi:hypothetical protein